MPRQRHVSSSQERRAAPRRSSRSHKFERSLQIAKSCKIAFSVSEIKTLDDHCQKVGVLHTTGSTYNVTINGIPDCDDCKYCNSRDICSHIVWVLLYVYKVEESSDLLHQRVFLKLELESMFRNCSAPAGGSTSSVSESRSKWSIGQLHSRGKPPSCSNPKCSRTFQRDDVSIQVTQPSGPHHTRMLREKSLP